MLVNDSATRPTPSPLSKARSGWWWALLGVAGFSLTLPLTRLAIGGLSPLFISAGRAVVAAALAGLVLAATRSRPPAGLQWVRLAVVGAGVVVGFPVLTSLALDKAEASHSAVVIAILPAVTAVAAVMRTVERPGRTFWLFSLAGAAAAIGFAIVSGSGFGAPSGTDLMLLAGVVAAAVGYAEGGMLAREIGPWQTVSWALVVSSPLMLVLTGVSVAHQPPSGDLVEWASFGYLAVVSMYLGFFAWYRGLAIGPMASVSQVQLAQPVMSISWSALLLGESLTWLTVVGGLAVVVLAGGAVRSRLVAAPPPAGPEPGTRGRPSADALAGIGR